MPPCLTGELSHDLFHSPSSGVSVAVGAVRSDQVVCQINPSFDTNRTGLLQGGNKQIDMMSMRAYMRGGKVPQKAEKKIHSTCPSYKWQNPLMIFCL